MMTVDGVNSILSSYVPLDLLKTEYLGHLLSKNTITDADGRRYVHNRDVTNFIFSEHKKQLDIHASHKRLQQLQQLNDEEDETDARYR